MNEKVETGNARTTERGGGALSGLAGLPPDTLLPKKALAAALQVTPRSVQRMVARRQLPPPFGLGNRKCWLAGSLAAWFVRLAEKAEDGRLYEMGREEEARNRLARKLGTV